MRNPMRHVVLLSGLLSTAAFGDYRDLPPPSQVTIPAVPAGCFDELAYCSTDKLFVNPLELDKLGSTEIQYFFKVLREPGETDQGLIARFEKTYLSFNEWPEYAGRITDGTDVKAVSYNISADVTQIAHEKLGYKIEQPTKGFHYVDYYVYPDLSAPHNIKGTYEHELLSAPVDKSAILSATFELITTQRDQDKGKSLASIMPVPENVTAQLTGVDWHWAYLHVIPDPDDAQSVIVILDSHQKANLIGSLLPKATIAPSKKAMLSIMGGMWDFEVDFVKM